jgi:hypothetical protein
MMTRILLVSGLVVGVIGGCASRAETTLDAPVDYQLRAFEATQHTMLHIEPDGTATRTRPHHPPESAKLDQATLDDLARKIEEAGFPTLEPTYGCGGCTDDAVYTIAVQVDGAPYTVQTDSMSDFPDQLRPVIDALRSISELPLDWH